MDAIYERVSHKSQKLAGQHAELARWEQAQEQPATWFQDKATGKKVDGRGQMIREKFELLMDQVRQGKFKRIVVWRLDRLGRTARGLVTLFDELVELGVTLVSLRDGFDLQTPSGRLIARIMASVSAYEAEILEEKQRAGIEAARDPITGKCSWGGRKPGTRITVTEEKEQAVRKMKLEGKTISEIARVVGLARKTIYVILKAEGNA